MKKEKGPLLYIDTITVINDVKKTEKFKKKEDSTQNIDHEPLIIETTNVTSHLEEEKVQGNQEEQEDESLESRKLNNIIEMYKKNRPVLCSIITKEEEIIGTPYQKADNSLFIKVSEAEAKTISLNDILEINIIKF